MIAYLDSHIAVYLAEADIKRLSKEARRVLDQSELLISPMVVIELEVLSEIGRISWSARDIQRKLEQEIDLRVCDLPFQTVAEVARDEAWTRDPFDRIIVAQAKANGFANLISADGNIAKHYPRTIW